MIEDNQASTGTQGQATPLANLELMPPSTTLVCVSLTHYTIVQAIGSADTLSRDSHATPESILLTWRNTTVVGGGTGGLALATRLAENPSISVAVVEAGGFYEADDGNISQVPAYDIFYAGTGANTTNPLVDWGFLTTPQAVC